MFSEKDMANTCAEISKSVDIFSGVILDLTQNVSTFDKNSKNTICFSGANLFNCLVNFSWNS